MAFSIPCFEPYVKPTPPLPGKHPWILLDAKAVMSTAFEQQATILDFELEEGEQSYVVSNRHTGEVLYEIDRLADSSTTVFRRSGQAKPFAVYQHCDIFSDKIALGGDLKPLKSWLKIKKTCLAATLKENGKEYTWMKGDNGPFNLVSESTKKRIACFRRQQRVVINGVATITQPYIALDPEAEEIMNAVIVSATVLEQNSRWVRKNDEWSVGKASIVAGSSFVTA